MVDESRQSVRAIRDAKWQVLGRLGSVIDDTLLMQSQMTTKRIGVSTT